MKAYEWSKDWNLPLNEPKCAFLTSGSSSPTQYSHFAGRPELQELHSVKDLGILLECLLKLSALCQAAVKNARAALFLVKRSFVNVTPAVILPLYCTLVRPLMDYVIQASSPYIKRLQRLYLCNLEKWRRRADLILAYGIFQGRGNNIRWISNQASTYKIATLHATNFSK